MENSINYLRTLEAFYSSCLSKGAVKLTKQSDDLYTLYIDDKKFFHFTSPLSIKIKKVCYIFPKRAKKNLDGIREALSDKYNSCLCCLDIKSAGGRFAIRLVNTEGKVLYKFSAPYTTINVGKKKKNRDKLSNNVLISLIILFILLGIFVLTPIIPNITWIIRLIFACFCWIFSGLLFTIKSLLKNK